MSKYYVTTPIYYVNDKPHIGHAYTTIAADVLARYYRQKLGPENVWFLTGTDEHGVKIAQAAEKFEKKPQEYADDISASFQFAWDQLNISNNDFIRTTEKRHEENVEFFVSKLKEAIGPDGQPVIYKGNYEGLYCYGCEAYKTESDLVDGKCLDHPNIEPAYLKEENWFFRLSVFTDHLKEIIERGDFIVAPESRKNEVLRFIEDGLDDIAISRANVDWGVKVPFDKDQTVYVWVDALINYVSALGYKGNDDKFKTFWPANVQLLAKDILKFHAIIWPAMLLANGLELPQVCFAHGYFTIDGQKMSKTIGNVIDPNQLVDEFGTDAARYLILAQYPFGHDGDIKADDFVIKYNADLANGIGNLVSRVLGMTEKYFEGQVPKMKYSADFDVKAFWAQLDRGYSELKLYENLKAIINLVSWCDNYIDQTKPWELSKSDNDKLQQVLYNLIELIRHLALAIYPYLPETAEKINIKLNINETINSIKFDKSREIGGMKSGVKIEKGEGLFARK
ncbi:methionine--tRNA ligase [Candidatus Falkowbacteria bacterium CG10_big_fil_rev_8_21_14_0_10_39_11]|uniref:Methionine--tRNA ligase n=1 Tax=Candidatus Falkowbacteria bacterium CG10_big_fil_rev_8_21_14_0_10_39_11 TaxID=1974565 RepID=A0A2H0V5R9_9BACT|nr:MAG: methionine--tRNA ligase [Candidatus Falkowbacteria bacterium CG10_big_fil_rev_8_21_14_0_10_39_11]